MNIAFFDFDGTITNADMFTKFLHFSSSKPRAFLARILLAPFILLYKLKIIPAPKMRAIASCVAFYGRDAEQLWQIGEAYSIQVIPRFLRPEAVNRLAWHKSNGDKIVIVSASLNVYLCHWCELNGYDLICTELEVSVHRLTGRYREGDCSCTQKQRKINSHYNLADFKRVYAYGDTKEDLAMLALADEAYYDWMSYPTS